MWKDEIIKEYEEIIIKLAICSAMEQEGEMLLKKSEQEGSSITTEEAKRQLEEIYRKAESQNEKDKS